MPVRNAKILCGLLLLLVVGCDRVHRRDLRITVPGLRPLEPDIIKVFQDDAAAIVRGVSIRQDLAPDPENLLPDGEPRRPLRDRYSRVNPPRDESGEATDLLLSIRLSKRRSDVVDVSLTEQFTRTESELFREVFEDLLDSLVDRFGASQVVELK